MFDIKNLKYNSDGLIPAIITDEADGAVLMLGYMNAESLGITLEKKKEKVYNIEEEVLPADSSKKTHSRAHRIMPDKQSEGGKKNGRK